MSKKLTTDQILNQVMAVLLGLVDGKTPPNDALACIRRIVKK